MRFISAATLFLLCPLTYARIADRSGLESASVAQTDISAADYENIQSVGAFSILWFVGRDVFYNVSMGSEHLYRSYAEVLLGRPAIDDAELTGMHLRIRIGLRLSSYAIITEGDSLDGDGNTVVHTLEQECSPKAITFSFSMASLSGNLCVPTSGSDGVKTELIATSNDKIVWESESVGAVLITRLVNDEVTDWKVLSLTETLPEETQGVILDKVKSLGLIL